MSFSRSLKQISGQLWEDCYNHPFVQQLGSGALPLEAFRFYLVQDYLYLYEYARVFALGAVKSREEALMAHFTAAQYGTLNVEMDLHRRYMAQFGIPLEQANATKPSLFNSAYTANMLAVAQTGDVLDILMTLFPCAWTYYDFGCRLKADFSAELQTNPYRSWIELYAGDEFGASFQWFYDAIDTLAQHQTEPQRQRLRDIFHTSLEFEYLFWDMAYKQQMSFR